MSVVTFNPIEPFTVHVESPSIPADRETYIPGSVRFTSANGVDTYFHGPRYRGRGNSTWVAPKKPFKVRSLDRLQRPFGYPASRDWAFMADYYDESYLRSTIGFELHRRATGRWAPRSQHVRLVWNGFYQGLYRYSETADVQAGRVDIRIMSDADTSGNALTGPYFLETDDLFADPAFRTARNTPVMLDAPGAGVAAQEAYVVGWVNALEDALIGGNDEAAILAFFDLPAAVDWYLSQEFICNVDARWHKSCKWIKDQDPPNGTGKAIIWPLWDLDLTMGNGGGGGGNPGPTGWTVRAGATTGDANDRPNWWNYLWAKSPTFQTACRTAWSERFAPAIDGLPAFIDAQQARIAPLIAEDRARWFGGTPQPLTHTAAWLKTWITARAAWITANL